MASLHTYSMWWESQIMTCHPIFLQWLFLCSDMAVHQNGSWYFIIFLVMLTIQWDCRKEDISNSSFLHRDSGNNSTHTIAEKGRLKYNYQEPIFFTGSIFLDLHWITTRLQFWFSQVMSFSATFVLHWCHLYIIYYR